jgi:hypothetical protein
MELWVDGTKVAEQFHTWGSRAWFNFSGTFAPGPHNAVIFAVDKGKCSVTLAATTVGADVNARWSETVDWAAHVGRQGRHVFPLMLKPSQRFEQDDS